MKNSSLTSKLLAAALTLGVLAYFGVQIYRYVDDPFSTTLVYSYRVEDTLDISGYMVRQEQVLTGESGGLMRLQKTEGSGSAPAASLPRSMPIKRRWTGRTRWKR